MLAGADLNIINDEGRTVLDMLDDYEGENCQIVHSLLRDRGGKRAMELVAETDKEL